MYRMSHIACCRICFFVSDNNVRIKIDINVNIPDSLCSRATVSRMLRAVHKTGYLRIGYCEKSNTLLSK